MKIKLTCCVKKGKTFYKGGRVYDFTSEEAKEMLAFGVPVEEVVVRGEVASPLTDATSSAEENKEPVVTERKETAKKSTGTKKSAKKTGAKKKTTKTK